jgi:8-oxo-dGTP pyrophosphatase MutT (NUDIX family)
MSARAATTILLVRPAASGLEVFMVQRHRKSGFLPNAWVFPGGRVDAHDAAAHPALQGGEALLAQLELPREQALAYAVAGVRETFEEAGVWLGAGAIPAEERLPLARGERRLHQLLDTYGATVELDRLAAWSWWVTPKAEPRRYDTRFLVCAVDQVEGTHDELETVDSRWVDPRAVLGASDQQAFPLAPPTWWTLRELAAFEGPESVVHSARARQLRPIQPIMQLEDRGIRLLLPGHPEHPEPAIAGVADRITFEDGWVAWRNDERLPALP